jgi:hypothetical protein
MDAGTRYTQPCWGAAPSTRAARAADCTVTMISATDFRTATCQVSVFTGGAKFETARLFKEVFLDWLERFDGEPTILPLPEGAPPELARIQLKSSDGAWRCNVGPARIDIHGSGQPGREQVDSREVIGIASGLLAQYVTRSGAHVNRLAAVVLRYMLSVDPGIALAQHFCKETWQRSPLNRPADFELHARKVFLMGGAFEVNSWVRARTGTVTIKPSPPATAILFEQDVNTLAEGAETRTYTLEQIAQFFVSVQPEFDVILGQYFPVASER